MKEVQDILDIITPKQLFELSRYERDFLRARQSYLSDDMKDKFKEVLNEVPPVKKPPGRPKVNNVVSLQTEEEKL